MQNIELSLDHFDFYCPITGVQILGDEHYEPSPATAFVYSPEAEEFEHIVERLEAVDSKVNTEEIMEEEPFERFERFCEAIKDEPNIVIFSITTHGMACGPVSSTIHVAIDMNYCAES